jgi:hypothetical protein
VSDQSLRDALQRLVDLKDGPRDERYYNERIHAWNGAREALAAHPVEPALHEPIGVRPTDAGVFVRCACGQNPTPKYWIEDHWPGERAEGERLVRDLLAAHLPGNRADQRGTR